MSVPAIPTADQLRYHAAHHPGHKFKAAWVDTGPRGRQVKCAVCRLAQRPKRVEEARGPHLSAAGPVVHERGTTRTRALSPALGITLGQLAAFLDAAFAGGHHTTDRVQVLPSPRQRAGDVRGHHRIDRIIITPGPREDAATERTAS